MALQISRLGQNSLYQASYETIKLNIHEKGVRPDAAHDPQAHTAARTYSASELLSICTLLANSSDSNMVRNLCMLLWLHCTVCRSDTLRLMHLADMCAPAHLKCIGAIRILALQINRSYSAVP